jgi:hypothetical protein
MGTSNVPTTTLVVEVLSPLLHHKSIDLVLILFHNIVADVLALGIRHHEFGLELNPPVPFNRIFY